MSNAVTKHEVVDAPASRSVVNHMELISRAAESGSLEMVERMMDLRDRFEKSEARKDFDAAISAAKAEIPLIRKNRTGHNNKTYADFSAIAAAIDPVLGRHGLSYRFTPQQADGKISVTCILSHRNGHSEDATLSAGADTSGSKNAIQALGSTLSYLKRYSLDLQLGLAVTDADDDDGHAAGIGEVITEDQAIALRDRLLACDADEAKFAKFFKVEGLASLPSARFADADRELSYLEQKKGLK